jgi:hypothetical protein
MSKDILAGKEDLTVANFGGQFIGFFRKGAYCNLNDIAEATGKRLDNWMRLKSTKDYVAAFKADRSYNGKEPFKIVRGDIRRLKPIQATNSLQNEGTGERLEGTWAHPDLAIEFARWCSPAFGLWCNRQIRHLLTHGEVNLHHAEWTPQQHSKGIQYNRDDIEDMYGSRR